MLKVKLITDTATPPTVSHPGEDLGYDLYASESITIPSKGHARVRTGVAVEFQLSHMPEVNFGFLVKPRSSIGSRGMTVLGGVIDSGYRGEIFVMLGNFNDEDQMINQGDKIANLIPIIVFAKSVEVVSELLPSARGEAGFGSTGL